MADLALQADDVARDAVADDVDALAEQLLSLYGDKNVET